MTNESLWASSMSIVNRSRRNRLKIADGDVKVGKGSFRVRKKAKALPIEVAGFPCGSQGRFTNGWASNLQQDRQRTEPNFQCS